MTDVTDIDLDPPQEPAPKGKKSLLLGLVAALLLGGGGFYATYSGLIGGSGGKDDAQAGAGDGHGGSGHGEGSEAAAKLLGNIAFVPLDPIMVSMPPGSTSRHLRFAGQLEVVPGKAEAVVAVMPRILDVLNTYLRAVEVSDLEEPASAARLRAQMLRRVQVVTGEGLVKDLLVTEFVMN
jgi:flagellar FliL protein